MSTRKTTDPMASARTVRVPERSSLRTCALAVLGSAAATLTVCALAGGPADGRARHERARVLVTSKAEVAVP